MITFLSGGTGTPKLLQGARKILKDSDISVVVNTGEDIWYQGGHISPDVDTVMFLFAGILNTKTWWGIENDSFITHDTIVEYLPDAYMAIGDKDRAIHLVRAELLKSGMNLTQVTDIFCQKLGITARVCPMSDDPWTTHVRTEEGDIHFQEYWVKHRGTMPITGVVHYPENAPDATRLACDSIRSSDIVVIGPSNPVTSILPILSCNGIMEELKMKKVVAISPFIGDEPVSGPAGQLMKTIGYPAGSAGVYAMYKDIVTYFIQDIRDPTAVSGAVRCDTLMKSPDIAAALMKEILALSESGE